MLMFCDNGPGDVAPKAGGEDGLGLYRPGAGGFA